MGGHRKLLRVIHHLLRLVRGWTRLQVRVVLGRWGSPVEGRAASSNIGIAIRSRVHGWLSGGDSRLAEPRAGRERAVRGGEERGGTDTTTTTDGSVVEIRNCGC